MNLIKYTYCVILLIILYEIIHFFYRVSINYSVVISMLLNILKVNIHMRYLIQLYFNYIFNKQFWNFQQFPLIFQLIILYLLNSMNFLYRYNKMCTVYCTRSDVKFLNVGRNHIYQYINYCHHYLYNFKRMCYHIFYFKIQPLMGIFLTTTGQL